MKIGAPTNDVIAEIGKISGDTTTCQRMSDTSNIPAPASAEAGRRKR